MVMHGQTDFMEILFGNDDFVTTDGDINFYVPQSRELEPDQQLNLEEIMQDEYLSIIPDMDTLLDENNCPVVAKTVEVYQEPTPSTSTLEYEEQQLVFQFPSSFSDADSTDTESTYAESSFSSTVPTTPFSPGSPFSLPPPTPDTASSTDSTSSRVPNFLKQTIKQTIQSKRRREGKVDLKVEFVPPPEEKLTVEEESKRVEKREKNKLAAQKCRAKKNARADVLEAETRKLEKKQSAYRTEIQKLIEERDSLMDIIEIHRSVCPKFRAKSTSF